MTNRQQNEHLYWMHILFVFNVLDKQVNQDHLLVDIL